MQQCLVTLMVITISYSKVSKSWEEQNQFVCHFEDTELSSTELAFIPCDIIWTAFWFISSLSDASIFHREWCVIAMHFFIVLKQAKETQYVLSDEHHLVPKP